MGDDWEDDDELKPVKQLMARGDDWDDEEDEDADEWEKDADDAPAPKLRVEKDFDEESEDEEEQDKTEGGLSQKARRKLEKEAALKKKEEEEVDPDSIPCSDPVEEKERLKRLQEREGAEQALDLFGGFEKEGVVKEELAQKKKTGGGSSPSSAKVAKVGIKVETRDLFDDFHILTTAHCDGFVRDVKEKMDVVVKEAKLKDAWLTVLQKLFKSADAHLTLEDLEMLKKKMSELVKAKKLAHVTAQAAKTARERGDNAGNAKHKGNPDKIDVQAAVTEVYGGEWDEDWEEGDWEEGGEWDGYYDK